MILPGARRLVIHPTVRCMRRALGMWCVGLSVLIPSLSLGDTIQSARYADPTTRYDHGILGDAIEWGTLELHLKDGTTRRFILPDTMVFEDTAPRIADLDGDGFAEIIVVESSVTLGARLVVYGPQGRLAMTDHIGRKNRWLAPAGVADFTGDGRSEIAIVVTPHLAGRVEVLSYDGKTLTPIATLDGFTNHRIGDTDIAGGIRDCGAGPEILLAEMPWRKTGSSALVALRLTEGRLTASRFARNFTAENIRAAASCQINPQ